MDLVSDRHHDDECEIRIPHRSQGMLNAFELERQLWLKR